MEELSGKLIGYLEMPGLPVDWKRERDPGFEKGYEAWQFYFVLDEFKAVLRKRKNKDFFYSLYDIELYENDEFISSTVKEVCSGCSVAKLYDEIKESFISQDSMRYSEKHDVKKDASIEVFIEKLIEKLEGDKNE